MSLDRLLVERVTELFGVLRAEAMRQPRLALKNRDIARHFDCSIATADKMMRNGTFRTVRHERTSYVPLSELTRFLDSGVRYSDLPEDYSPSNLSDAASLRAVIRDEFSAVMNEALIDKAVETGSRVSFTDEPDLRRIV